MNFALRRPSRRRIAAAIVVVLIACVLANLFVSSAAQLNLGPISRQHAEVKASCDLDGVTLTTPSTSGTTNRVDVSGISGSCAGLPIVVRVATDTAGPLTSSSTTAVNVPAGGGSMTLSSASPAFDPDDVVQTSVTIGTWPMRGTWTYAPPAPTTSCSVYRIVGGTPVLQAGKTCQVTSITGRLFGGDPANDRKSWVTFNFSWTGAEYPDYFQFTVDMTQTTGLPSDYKWTTAGAGTGQLTVTSACSAMPIFSGSTPTGWGPVSSIEHLFYEVRQGKSPLGCS